MSYAYDVHSFLYQAQKNSDGAFSEHHQSNESGSGNGNAQTTYSNTIPYPALLSRMRKELADNHAEELRDAVGSSSGGESMRGTLMRLLNGWRLNVTGMDNMAEVVDRLHDDLFGFSFLTKYIHDPDVQEINCNRWDDIEICTSSGWRKLSERFLSPTQAADIAKRMALLGGLVLDGSVPTGDSYITEGIRIHAKLPPAIDEEDGVHFSIRKQRREVYSADELISLGTATKDMLDLLELCIRHSVSVGFCGNTGSGKTTDLNWLLNSIPDRLRVYTIEDTRELSLHRRNLSGEITNRVMHTKTRYSDILQNVDARLLVRDGLRCDPDIIVPSEMRGAEAMDVLEAARTGHTLASTFHAKSAKEAYSRIVTMAMMANTALSEGMLLELAYQAFPIICHKRRLADGSRKYVEICEAVETENGYTVVPLFKFVVENNKYDEDGTLLEIRGRHVKKNPISDVLANALLLGGAQWKDIRRFARNGYQPERGV